LVTSACQDAKGIDVALYDVTKVTDLAERFVIVSGRSDRHVQGIANRILQELQNKGIKPDATEGFDQAHWIVLDFENIIIHLFYEPVRMHYDLESLWYGSTKLPLTTAASSSSNESEAA
jgi:ribosome-associated protein